MSGNWKGLLDSSCPANIGAVKISVTQLYRLILRHPHAAFRTVYKLYAALIMTAD